MSEVVALAAAPVAVAGIGPRLYHAKRPHGAGVGVAPRGSAHERIDVINRLAQRAERGNGK